MLHAHLNYITTKFKTRALFSFVTLSLCLSSSDAGSLVSSLWLLWRREEVCLHHRAEMIRLPSAPQHSVDWSSPPLLPLSISLISCLGKAFICGIPVVSDGETMVGHLCCLWTQYPHTWHCLHTHAFTHVLWYSHSHSHTHTHTHTNYFISVILTHPSLTTLPYTLTQHTTHTYSVGMKYSLISQDWIADCVEKVHET